MCVPPRLHFRHGGRRQRAIHGPFQASGGDAVATPPPDKSDIWCHRGCATLLGRVTRGSGSEDRARTRVSGRARALDVPTIECPHTAF